jgi:hypothetical protein
MYFDDIIKQAESPIEKKVFTDKDEEMFVSIFKAEDDGTGESLENPDDNAGGGNNEAGAQGGGDTGENLENPDQGGNDQGNQGGQDNGTGENLENPDQGGEQQGNQGGQDDGSGENLENPDQGGQDPNAAPQQDPNAQPAQDPNQQNADGDNKVKDINERIQLFRQHRKLEDTVSVLYDSVSAAISQVVTVDSRVKLLRIQKDLLVTRGQIEYALSLDFQTVDMDQTQKIYSVLLKKVSLMSDTIKKIKKENAET